MNLIKKKLYYNNSKSKYIYNLYTYNRILYKYNNIYHNINIYKQKLYKIHIYIQEQNKLYIKEISGILIKKNKIQNLTNLHLFCLKRYNNIYLSFFKEHPNILIKYKNI